MKKPATAAHHDDRIAIKQPRPLPKGAGITRPHP
jgi:hypothetical protein